MHVDASPRFAAPSWRRWALLTALAALAVLAVTHFVGAHKSEGARITAALSASHPDVTCSRVGLLAVAGGRSALYGCQWATATGGGITGLGVARRCLVWADGGAYDVTRQARTMFRLQGQRAPC